MFLAKNDTKTENRFFHAERNRRPPLDNMNAMLSFLYTLLAHDVESALETVGSILMSVSFIPTGQEGQAWHLI